LKYFMIFLVGFLSSCFLFYVLSYSGIEVPLGNSSFILNGVAPGDWITEENILILDDRIVIFIDDASISRYAATGSMKPTFDIGANGIRIVPESSDSINVGDIISFRTGGKLVVHRVIEKGEDYDGVYFITQGDNNIFSDGKVRFSDIEYVTIGILW